MIQLGRGNNDDATGGERRKHREQRARRRRPNSLEREVRPRGRGGQRLVGRTLPGQPTPLPPSQQRRRRRRRRRTLGRPQEASSAPRDTEGRHSGGTAHLEGNFSELYDAVLTLRGLLPTCSLSISISISIFFCSLMWKFHFNSNVEMLLILIE